MSVDQQPESPGQHRPELKMNAAQLGVFMEGAFGRPMTWDIERVDLDGVTVRQHVGDDSLRPGGTISGPTLMALADAIAYLVVLSRIGPEALAVTSNLNINFLRRPRPGDLVIHGKSLKIGRSLAVMETWIYSDSAGGPTPKDVSDLGDPVAHAIVTYSMSLIQQSEPA